jgi:hypothetical protein
LIHWLAQIAQQVIVFGRRGRRRTGFRLELIESERIVIFVPKTSTTR